MKLTIAQRYELKRAAERGIDAIDEVLRQIRNVNPGAFHTPGSLETRAFALEPTQEIPCREVRIRRKDGIAPNVLRQPRAQHQKSASDAG